MKNYTAFCNKSLNDLLVEALNDEKNMLMSKDRLLKQHLIDYRMYLIKSGIATSTIKNYLSKVKTFYKHYGVDIPDLPLIKYNKDYVINYNDLPSKKDIERVLDIVTLDLKI